MSDSWAILDTFEEELARCSNVSLQNDQIPVLIILKEFVLAVLFRGSDNDGILEVLTTNESFIIKLKYQLLHFRFHLYQREVHFLVGFHFFGLFFVISFHEALFFVEKAV